MVRSRFFFLASWCQVVAHDGLLLSVMQEGRRLHKLREEEQRRIREEERLLEEQRRKEEQENQRCEGLKASLYYVCEVVGPLFGALWEDEP